MEKVAFFLLILFACMAGGYYWSCYKDQSNAKVVNPNHDECSSDSGEFSDPHCLQCNTHLVEGFTGSSMKKPCKSSADLGKAQGEFHRQIQLISKEYQNIDCYCESQPLIRNYFRLPNIGSKYLGASVISGNDTIHFVPPNSKCGLTGCTNDIDTIILPEIVIPGKNWRFKGQNGSIVIELAKSALITGLTMIHPSNKDIPLGYFTSAPMHFAAFGIKSLSDLNSIIVKLGNFIYSEHGPPAQTFPVQIDCKGEDFTGILIKFKENYGNPEYTAIYKIEIHGIFV